MPEDMGVSRFSEAQRAQVAAMLATAMQRTNAQALLAQQHTRATPLCNFAQMTTVNLVPNSKSTAVEVKELRNFHRNIFSLTERLPVKSHPIDGAILWRNAELRTVSIERRP